MKLSWGGNMDMLSKWPIAAAMILVLGCSSRPQDVGAAPDALPDWVTELPVSSGWIYGVGSAVVGDDPATAAKLARQRARLDMLESLQVEVSGSSQVRVEQHQGNVQTDIVQQMRVDIPETQGWQIEIIESQQVDDQIFVLAGLDRQKEAARIRRVLSDLNVINTEWPELVINLRNLMAVKNWLAKADEWDELQQQHLYVTGRYATPRLPDWFSRLEQWADYLSINLRIQVTGYPQLDQVGGWPVVQTRAPVLLNLNLSREERIQQNRAYYFVVGDVRLSDATGFSQPPADLNARGVSSLSERSRALAEQDLNSQILDYLNSVMPLLSDFDRR